MKILVKKEIVEPGNWQFDFILRSSPFSSLPNYQKYPVIS